MSLVLALVASVAVLAEESPLADRVVLIHADLSTSKRPLFLDAHAKQADPNDFVGGVLASERRVGRATGKKRVAAAFAADTDGDGVDELVLVKTRRATPGARLELRVHRMPTTLGAALGAPTASAKRDVGIVSGDGAAVAFCGANLDGSEGDELVTVRAFSDGSRSLEVRRFPATRNARLGAPIATVAAFGTSADDPVAICGIEQPFQPVDLLAVLRRGPAGDRLVVHGWPTLAGATLGPVVASAPDVSAPAGSLNESMFGLWSPIDLTPLIGFLERAGDGAARLSVRPIPTALDQPAAPPQLVDATPGVSLPNVSVFAAIGARVSRGVIEKSDLAGTWALCLSRASTDPHSGPPIGLDAIPVTATISGNDLTFRLPTGETIHGVVDAPHFPNGSITFDPATFVHPDGPEAGVIQVHFGVGALTRYFEPSELMIDGYCPATPDCGGEFDVSLANQNTSFYAFALIKGV